MTSDEIENRFEPTGLIILTGVFFLYAYKTVKLLTQNQNNFQEEKREISVC